jgi:pimeloyl-ACP methyl ester carboxylesterase
MMSGWVEYERRGFSSDESFERVFGEEPSTDLTTLWDLSREMTARVTWKPWMWSHQLPAMLVGVEVPTLVVWGGADEIVPSDCAAQYASILPNARLELLDEVGHNADLEAPEALAQLVRQFTTTPER